MAINGGTSEELSFADPLKAQRRLGEIFARLTIERIAKLNENNAKAAKLKD